MRECFSRKRQSHLHVEGLSRCYLSRLIGSDGGIHLIQNDILFRQRSLSWLLNQHEFACLRLPTPIGQSLLLPQMVV